MRDFGKRIVDDLDGMLKAIPKKIEKESGGPR